MSVCCWSAFPDPQALLFIPLRPFSLSLSDICLHISKHPPHLRKPATDNNLKPVHFIFKFLMREKDCDTWTYRQVCPTFPKRADAHDVNRGFHIGRCRKTWREESREYSTIVLLFCIWSCPNNGRTCRYVPTSSIAESIRRQSTESRETERRMADGHDARKHRG